MRLGLFAAAGLVLSAPAFADLLPPKPQAQPAAGDMTLSCTGPFVKTATHASLVKHFGAKNVAWETVDGPEGSTYQVTAIYPKDPKKRLEVMWRDEEGRKDLLGIDVKSESTMWNGPGGLKMKMPIAAVEKLNGKPFMMTGYEWDMWGQVVDWKGGKMPATAKTAGCDVVTVRLDATGDTSKVGGEGPYASNSKGIKKAKPVVESFGVGLAYPEAAQ
jgi:hypothetical protein